VRGFKYSVEIIIPLSQTETTFNILLLPISFSTLVECEKNNRAAAIKGVNFSAM
jgi:hypothetical protein